MEKRFVYCDNAATTKVSKRALEAAMPYFSEKYGNPSSIYDIGMSAAKDLVTARERVASALGAKANEIYFTSGGSEADNWAIKGAALLGEKKGKKHIITSVFEHHAVLHTCEFLEKRGFRVTYIPVSDKGLVNPKDIEAAICDETCLVTIMYANNEIGTIQPIPEIGEICRAKGVLFHTDAVQAIGAVEINVAEMKIDMLSLSAHKIHGMKGSGALYVRNGVALPNLVHGGAQERSRRAGTENTPAIMALAQAIQDATADIPAKVSKVTKMRNRLIDELLKIPESRLNGDRDKRLCSNLNISFRGVEGESLLLTLDLNGICASSGSACTSGSLDPSHVLLSIGLIHEVAHGSMRLSISEETTDEDIDYIISVVPEVVAKLRAMSPLWERICREENIG